MIVYSEDEHKWLRRVSGEFGEAVAEVTSSRVPADEALLALHLNMLVLLLMEQLELEDRCLWPRARSCNHAFDCVSRAPCPLGPQLDFRA
jgi:hypothetical protein